MGVQGLTSYVNQKSDIFFESYKLKDCIIIIDGYSLASLLYNSHSKINAAFGGDYDKYCKIISTFFETLKKCNVIPVVVCDGGHEKKKLSTVKRRNFYRVSSLSKISPSSYNHQCFPLMMRHVFKEKLLELSVPVLQTDFEADNEIAALARKLNAPVLSNDSDFFIFDVTYIPLTSMKFNSCAREDNQFYIPCKVFKINNLLKNFNLPKTMLPLLATVLGNDYIKANQFKLFYNHLKMDKSKKLKPGQKRVKGIVDWLKEETFDSALHKILECLKKNARRRAKRNIKKIVKGYTNISTTLYDYLPDSVSSRCLESSQNIEDLVESFKVLNCIENFGEIENKDILIESTMSKDFEIKESNSIDLNVDHSDDQTASEISEKESDINSGDSDEEDTLSSEDEEQEAENGDCKGKNISVLPSWLLNESRMCNLYPAINTLLLLKTYLYCPQVEDYDYPWAGSVALPILQVIIGLLGISKISYWHRVNSKYVCSSLTSINSINHFNFPVLTTLNKLSETEKKLIIFETLKVQNHSVLDSFPPDWQLYLMSIIYWVETNCDPVVKHWHIHALVITLITVNVIGKKVGLFWQKKRFMDRYGSMLKPLLKRPAIRNKEIEYKTVVQALEAVTTEDCLLALESLIPYYHVDDTLNRNSKKFSRSIIHIYAQLQSVFELAVTLNYLLLQPFKRSHLGMFYNGTFMYNFTVNFKSRSNILSYMKCSLLIKAPSIFNLYKIISNTLMELIPSVPRQLVKIKKKLRRKKDLATPVEPCIDNMSDINVEAFTDANNRFSILSNKVVSSH